VALWLLIDTDKDSVHHVLTVWHQPHLVVQ